MRQRSRGLLCLSKSRSRFVSLAGGSCKPQTLNPSLAQSKSPVGDRDLTCKSERDSEREREVELSLTHSVFFFSDLRVTVADTEHGKGARARACTVVTSHGELKQEDAQHKFVDWERLHVLRGVQCEEEGVYLQVQVEPE